MFLRIDVAVNFGDAPLGVDDETVAFGELDHFKIQQSVILSGDPSVGIGQETERQFELFGKILMGGHRIDTDAEDHRLLADDGVDVIAKTAGLFGAAGGVVFRVKIEHYPLSEIVFELALLLVLVNQRESWCAVARLQFRGMRATYKQQGRQQSEQFGEKAVGRGFHRDHLLVTFKFIGYHKSLFMCMCFVCQNVPETRVKRGFMQQTTEFPRLKIAVSDCLKGVECRYNGGHAQDDFVKNQLAQYADFVPFCPEAAVIGTPRETVRLVDVKGQVRVLGGKSHTDYTDGLQDYTEKRVELIKQRNVDGAVVKSRSPSCGLERIKVYRETGEWFGSNDPMGQGLFTGHLQKTLPHLAIEEEGRLQDAWLRENFVMQVFSAARWRVFLTSEPGVADFQAFHRDHKYLLLSKNEALYRKMGPIVAQATTDNLEESLDQYGELFYQAIAEKAKRGQIINVLQHVYGYFKKQITDTEKTFFNEALEEFRDGMIPLIAVIKILQQFMHHYGSDYLSTQVFFQPYPAELALRSTVGAYK